MRTYTKKEKKALGENPYTCKVTDHKLIFTEDFRREFWRKYEAGEAPRQILTELGYDLKMFSQQQIDNLVQRTKKQAESGDFRERKQPGRPNGAGRLKAEELVEPTAENMTRMTNELLYLRQEIDFMKRIVPELAAGKRA